MVFKRAVFTIAVGKPIYFQMACALARSFKLWNRGCDIPFFLATDAVRHALPKDLEDIGIIPLKPGQYGRGFSPKLFLNEIAPAHQSLFIDADCLCVGSLEGAFDAFKGRSVSVIGKEINDGDWFGDVASICKRFSIQAMPRFNGGIYYLERGEACDQVYETAQNLEARYDEIGMVRLRNCPNDEVLLSLAMALHGQKPIPERGDIMNSLLAGPAGVKVDVFMGTALLRNPKGHSSHNPWYELEELRPRLIHFLGSDITEYPYRQEVMRLELVCGRDWPLSLATIIVKAGFTWPWMVRRYCKNVFRPFYHALFGPREVKTGRAFN